MRKIPKKVKRFLFFSIIASLLTAALLLFPSCWGPWVAEKVILSILPSSDNSLDIEVIGKNTLRISKIELKGLPMAPSCSSIEVQYSLPSLIRKHIKSVDIQDLSFDPSWQGDGFAPMPVCNAAKNNPDTTQDPLNGWSLGRFSLSTAPIDLRTVLPTPILPFTTNTCLTLSMSASMGDKEGNAQITGEILGSPISGKLKYSRQAMAGKFTLSYHPPLETVSIATGALIADSTFNLSTTNGLSAAILGKIGFAKCNWLCGFNSVIGGPTTKIQVEIQESAISDSDPLFKAALDLATIPDIITELNFGAKLSAKFEAAIQDKKDPKWHFSGSITDGSLNLKASEIPIKIEGVRAHAKITGIADLWQMNSIPISISKTSISSFNLTKGRAFLRADDKSLMASEITIGFCGGFLRLYALYFNFERLNTGFTIVLDSLKADEFIKQFPELGDSTASGTLHGRLPLSITKDGEIRLRDGYIYSPPGEKGNISIQNPTKIISTLSNSGMPIEVCDNLGKALQNLNYDILRFDLNQPRQNNGSMKIKLKGESPNGKISTPVDLNININGPIEQLLNLSVKTAKMKGK